MIDVLKCKLGYHKPVRFRQKYKHKSRTTNKGGSKRRWRTWAYETVTITYCERCGKTLKTKTRLKLK